MKKLTIADTHKKKWKCTAYFKGGDGFGTCDSGCQWYHPDGCPCAKGSKLWDGKESSYETS